MLSTVSSPLPGHQSQHASPRAVLIVLYRRGMHSMGTISLYIEHMQDPFMLWLGHLMILLSSLLDRTRRHTSGQRGRATPSIFIVVIHMLSKLWLGHPMAFW